jgi:hypothetical protein
MIYPSNKADTTGTSLVKHSIITTIDFVASSSSDLNISSLTDFIIDSHNIHASMAIWGWLFTWTTSDYASVSLSELVWSALDSAFTIEDFLKWSTFWHTS